MKNLLYFFLSLLVISCVETADHSTISIDNVLTFQKPEDFQDELDIVGSMNESELDRWESLKGFVSYRTALANAYRALDQLKTEGEEKDFERKFAHILKLKDSIWTPTIDIHLYQSFVNENGFYQTGKTLHRVVGDYIVSGKLNQYSAMKKLTVDQVTDGGRLNDIQGLKIDRFTRNSEGISLRNKAACTTDVRASYFHNESNCRNDREVHVRMRSFIALSTTFEGDWRQPKAELHVYGLKRQGTLCKWYAYSTELSYTNVSYALNGWSIVNNVPISTYYKFDIPDRTSPTDYTNLYSTMNVGSRVLNQIITENPFIEVHAEGTSRGTAGHYAILDCR